MAPEEPQCALHQRIQKLTYVSLARTANLTAYTLYRRVVYFLSTKDIQNS